MSLGMGRLSEDLQELQHAVASIYTEEEGYYVWGQRPVPGIPTNIAPVVGRSYTEIQLDTFTPCPPTYADYTFLLGAIPGGAVVPTICNLETLYSGDYIMGGSVYRCWLIEGDTYRVQSETDYTQPGFDEDHAGIVMWSPSAWPGETNVPWNETYQNQYLEDDDPLWCPYPYKLNRDVAGNWLGGRRFEFIAEETGYYVFMFLRT